MAKNAKKTWEPEYRYQAIKGTFVDYRGNIRDYTMVAVSLPSDIVAQGIMPNYYCAVGCEKVLSLGVAVRSARDAENGLGERIAYGKATTFRNDPHLMFVTHSGMINTQMVNALLKQEAAHFEKNPGTYIAGYEHDKKRYESTGKIGSAELTHQDAEKNASCDCCSNRCTALLLI